MKKKKFRKKRKLEIQKIPIIKETQNNIENKESEEEACCLLVKLYPTITPYTHNPNSHTIQIITTNNETIKINIYKLKHYKDKTFMKLLEKNFH